MLLLTCVHRTSPRLLVALAFLLPYMAMLCISFWQTGLFWSGCGLAFGMALSVRLITVPAGSLAVALLLCPLAYLGLPRSLAAFPWETATFWKIAGLTKSGPTPSTALSTLGWPSTCRPRPTTLQLSSRQAVLIAALAGWWAFAVFQARKRAGPRAMIFGLTALLCVSGRLVLYCWNYRPPISLWGRIRTLRWIIPRYDYVFLAPLCTAMVAVAAPFAAAAIGLGEEIAIPISLTLVLLITSAQEQTLRDWRLTGHHRIVPGLISGTTFSKV